MAVAILMISHHRETMYGGFQLMSVSPLPFGSSNGNHVRRGSHSK
jgi:hypothetical protein